MSIDYRLHPKLYPSFPLYFSSNRTWIFFIERYKLSSILYANLSIRPDFYFISDFYLLFSTNYWPICLIVLFISCVIVAILSSGEIFSDSNWHKIKTDSIVMTRGLPNRFFQGILRLNPLIVECLMMMGRWYFWSNPFLSLRFLILILPDHIPTLSYFESTSSKNYPRFSLSIFSKYFSNIITIWRCLICYYRHYFNPQKVILTTHYPPIYYNYVYF